VYTLPMQLNRKLIEQIPIHSEARNHADAFGVEIELEGQNISKKSANISRYWVVHPENSLRALSHGDECIEYVSKHPMTFENIEISLAILLDFIKTPPAVVYDSYRTSVHVHLNFAHETYRTIYNMMVLSITLDELLTSQAGDHRIGNNFCLRVTDAYGIAVGLIRSIQNGNNFFGIEIDDRYASVNFASLLKYGSIEFRAMECSIHYGRIIHWIKTLQTMKERARNYTNPAEIIRKFSLTGPKGFLEDVLGPMSRKYLTVDGYENMLKRGMRNAQDLAFCSTWKEAS